MKCPICGGVHINFSSYSYTKHRGCLAWLGWWTIPMIINAIALYFFINRAFWFGMVLAGLVDLVVFIGLLATNSYRVSRTVAICSDCGYKWYI